MSSLQIDDVRKLLQNIFPEKEPLHEPHDSESNKLEAIKNEAFLELLQHLEHYYPKRMSRATFHLIHKTSVYNTQSCSEKELPFYFLQKLLTLDYGLRYLVFKDDGNTEKQVHPSASNRKMRLLIHMKTYLKRVIVPLTLQPLIPGPTFTLWIFRWQFFTVQMIMPDNIFCPNLLFVGLPSHCLYLIPAILRLNTLSGLSAKLGEASSKQVNHQKRRTITTISRCIVSLLPLCPLLKLERASLLPNLRS